MEGEEHNMAVVGERLAMGNLFLTSERGIRTEEQSASSADFQKRRPFTCVGGGDRGLGKSNPCTFYNAFLTSSSQES